MNDLPSLLKLVSDQETRKLSPTVKPSKPAAVLVSPPVEYVEACLSILDRARLIANFRVFEGEERFAAGEAWAEACYQSGDGIPYNELENCFALALRNRNNSYPLRADELLAAWRSDRLRRSQPGAKTAPCGLCGGAGAVLVWIQKEKAEVLKFCSCPAGRAKKLEAA